MTQYESLNDICDDEFCNIIQTNPLHRSLDISFQNNIVSYKTKKHHNFFEVETTTKETKEVFMKYITLVDFLKYLIGKYKSENTQVLPCQDIKNASSKFEKYINEPNNYAYVDSFFYYLSSMLKTQYYFPHGLQCYDQFICNKKKCRINIADDLEYLCDSNYFNENINKLFYFDDPNVSNLFLSTQKDKIVIEDDIIELNDIEIIDEIDTSKSKTEDICEVENHDDDDDNDDDDDDDSEYEDDDDNDDSESIHTSDDGGEDEEEDEEDEDEEDEDEYEDDEDDEDDEDEDENEDEDEYDEEDEDHVMLNLKSIPIQAVVLEKCENTFDSLLEEDELTVEELESAMFQIIVMLYTYQKAFQFTHNDLHTNNIMYVKTDQTHLTYCIENKFFKVPTFGKVYKIIDFGRAIYTYKNSLICSDSFSTNGTAHTQYNFGPYYDSKKPVIEPNYSFDLCRLACSMFDFICDDIQNIKKYMETTPVYDLIFSWLYDDNGRNMLYRSNGTDKYPGFKLYKMISKIVHQHLPEKQLSHKCFKKYVIDATCADDSYVNVDAMIKEFH